MRLQRMTTVALLATLVASLPLLVWGIAWPYPDMASGMVTTASSVGAAGSAFALLKLRSARGRTGTSRGAVIAVLTLSVVFLLLVVPTMAAIAFSVSQGDFFIRPDGA